jgi:hypothetical protein
MKAAASMNHGIMAALDFQSCGGANPNSVRANPQSPNPRSPAQFSGTEKELSYTPCFAS